LATAFLGRTRAGRGLRAIADDEGAARLVGLPVDRLLTVAFAIAGCIAAIGALAAAPSAPFDVAAGALLGVKGLVAALLVRFGPPWHALAGGFALGLLEAAMANADLAGLELGAAWSQVVPLALALLVLGLWPLREARSESE
jgi:branched-chain amino acid transport system permease protein